MKKKMIVASIGNCVHAAGIYNFSVLARKEGYEVEYLGSAVPLRELVGGIIEFQPHVVALSYRLSKEGAEYLLRELERIMMEQNFQDLVFIFGGTVETAEAARKFSYIRKVFDGTEEEAESLIYLRSMERGEEEEGIPPQTLRERIEWKKPFPIIRHHIGLETLEDTEEHIRILAESRLLDVISLAPDQNCQEYYYHQEAMPRGEDGAGGVPIRTEEDLRRMYAATRRGNYPMMRCYSGTRDMLPFSRVLKETLNNAWAAIPLTWYSQLDRRSDRELLTAIRENMEAIQYNAQMGVPVEMNESHQWALRYCSDVVEVAISYITAKVAKHLGVKDMVMQYMLANPPSISPIMDLAKMQAKIDLMGELEDESFRIIRMVRTGLLAYPADMDKAKGLIASTMFYGTFLKPDIVHVVSYSEAVKRATSREILESVRIVNKSMEIAERGLLESLALDPAFAHRLQELKKEVRYLLGEIAKLKDTKDPLTDPEVIYLAIKEGLLDAPGLKGFSVAQGNFRTEIHNGYHVTVDEDGAILDERTRIQRVRDLGESRR
ncbi:cobalamin B12-binding domain-containing protein [Proteiniclasticum sp. BAD-10]|uniref:Cobalamin B12-binding domain-containing protein n=1 Tax=Proteiniclasticum sediminis TaxID=2804028 RepID=A0A941CQQ7_9CLOT|nr:cobalamin B12-binding domain-containing protein [Proteiniclasticum sediminis]MBR0576497.1 cobalamin B12-binding domain-containing protein [Proteiniclasticum sediminis]